MRRLTGPTGNPQLREAGTTSPLRGSRQPSAELADLRVAAHVQST